MPGHKDWIKKAFNDLNLAKKAIQDDDSFLEGAAYLLHQSVEKSLKAVLMYHHEKIEKTHDLEYLLELCVEKSFALAVFKKQILLINPYKSKACYPDDYFTVTRHGVLEAIEIAGKILKIVAEYVHVKI